MDTFTYVVVSGWVLMYFTPSISVAFACATLMAFLASLLVFLGQGGGPVTMAGFLEAATPVAPVAFVAIFMAWPLGLCFRRLREWRRRKATGV